MRIAYVCADPGVPVFGRKGASIHVQEVMRGLMSHGAQIDLFAMRTGGPAPSGVTVHALPKPDGTDVAERERSLLAANAALREALEREGPFDVVYERHALWSFATMEYAADKGVPGLLEVNSPLIEEQATYRGLADKDAAHEAAGRAFRAARALLAVSVPVADYLRREFGTGDRTHVVPNGVNTDRIRPDVAPSLPGPDGCFTVGFIGTLKAWHGTETLVEAVALLRDRGCNARLLIVGDGPEHQNLIEQAGRLGISDALVMTGAVVPESVPGLLTSMDAGVAPYPELEHFYFSPLKLYEYMAAGLPVVASDIGQVADVIRHGTTGLLCTPGDAQALACALAELTTDQELRRQLGANAREAAVRDHTWQAVTARILELAGRAPSLSTRRL